MSELRIERAYAIAPARLFDFVTKADNLMKWWGPEGTTLTEVKLDLTRPGPWSVVFNNPRGSMAMRGIVKTVNPPHAVEFTMNVPGESADSIVRSEIAPDGTGGSRFTLIQSGISDEMVRMGMRGWVSTLDRLAMLMGASTTAA